jgi:photosystem II stability/assembly factor-like uncharacterized protein
MSFEICLATQQGLIVCRHAKDKWQLVRRGLNGQPVTSVIAREGVILAGTTNGVFRSDDRAQTWREVSRGLSVKHVRWLAYHPDRSDFEFAGTEPAAIFVSHDGAETWRECVEVAALRDAHEWFLPYSPQAGCIRGFAFNGQRAYAAAEVGGALRSDNGGATWRLCDGSDGKPDLDGAPAPLIYPDVHSIEVQPSSPDLVYAPTGGGFYRSRDGGATWTLHYDCYCRAVWIDPRDPDHLILGPAEGVSSNGRIEESRDGGQSWQPAAQGLDVPWRRYMVERFLQVEDQLLAVLSNGQLLAASLTALEWQRVLSDVTGINAVWPVSD